MSFDRNLLPDATKALSMALFHIRKSDTHQAVAKAIRATSLLKQSCSDLFTGGV